MDVGVLVIIVLVVAFAGWAFYIASRINRSRSAQVAPKRSAPASTAAAPAPTTGAPTPPAPTVPVTPTGDEDGPAAKATSAADAPDNTTATATAHPTTPGTTAPNPAPNPTTQPASGTAKKQSRKRRGADGADGSTAIFFSDTDRPHGSTHHSGSGGKDGGGFWSGWGGGDGHGHSHSGDGGGGDGGGGGGE